MVFTVTNTSHQKNHSTIGSSAQCPLVRTYLAGNNRASTKQAEQKQSTLTFLLKTLPPLPFLSSSLKYLLFFANKIETTIPLAAKTLRYWHVLCYPFPLLCSFSFTVLLFSWYCESSFLYHFFSYGTCLLADDKILFSPSFV